MSISTEELLQIKRELSARYQVDFDKELVPLIVELRETKQSVAAGLQTALSSLEVAAAKIDTTRKPVQFVSSSQAFWHGFGKWGLVGITASIMGFSSFLLVFNRGEERVRAQRLSAYIQHNRQLQAFSTLSANVTLEKTESGPEQVEYIKLYPASDFSGAQIGRHAVVDPACRCIKIPLVYLKE